MKFPHLAEHRVCTGCMACADSCSQQAINPYIGDDGHYYVKVEEAKCVGCLSCEKVCPVVSHSLYSQSEIADFRAVWNKNDEERRRSASGGAFSAMAHYILDNGGIVIGAAIENVCDVRHIVVSDIKDLNRLQGSKYTQSNTIGIYKITFKLLKEGKTVLFSGTGCQVAGLLSIIRHKHYDGKLITVDLICGGVPSKHLIKKFIDNESYHVKRLLSFRTKDHGWKPKGFVYNLKVEDTEGEVHDYVGKKNLVTTGFSTEMTNRYSCYNCKFVGTHRQSDFTIGDLWGDNKFPYEHFNGLSLVIAHSENAYRMLQDMKNYLHISSYDASAAVKSNYRLVDGTCIMGNVWERKLMPELFRICSYSVLKKIYANSYPNYSPWMMLKIFRKFYTFILTVMKKLKIVYDK